MELMDLNRDALLLITSKLEDDDKLELLSIIPGIAEQISTCNIQSSPDLDVYAMAQVFETLENVKKVTIDETGWGWNSGSAGEVSTRNSILRAIARVNPRIQRFKFGRSDNPTIEDVSTYIEEVRRMDDTYDASIIDHTFMLDSKSFDTIWELLDKYPNLKLKLENSMVKEKSWIAKRNIGHLITGLTLHSTTVLNTSYAFVRKVSLIDIGGSPLDVLQSAINMSPLLNQVKLTLDVNSVAPFFEALKSVEQLRALEFIASKYIWTDSDFESFGKLLRKPSLKHVQVNSLRANHYGTIVELTSCTRSDLKSFIIRSDLFTTMSIQKGFMEIHSPLHFQHFRISDIYSKFKKIRKIVVDVNTAAMYQRVHEEFDIITSKCPNNASPVQTTVNFD